MSSANLAADTTFQARVKAELAVQCQNIATEAITVASLMLHVRRAQLVSQILQNLTGANNPNWPLIFAIGVATDTTVLSDATTGNTIDVTTTNASAQQVLITDVHIGNAISAQFNGFLQPV
jgi:hypothetical protein